MRGHKYLRRKSGRWCTEGVYTTIPHECVIQVKPRQFLIEDKKQALHMITLIKEKKCGNIKGRTCADVRTQRQYI